MQRLSSTAPAVVTSGASEPNASAIVVRDEVVGSHVLTIDGYSRAHGLNYGEFLSSAIFVAAGQRWSIRYYPGGKEASSCDWVAIYLQLRQSSGPTDVWARFTFSLLDRRGLSSHICTSKTHRFTSGGTPHGFVGFIRRKYLENSPEHLCGDCLSFRCDIAVLKVTNSVDAPATGFVSVPPPDVQWKLGHLLSTGEGADATFEVDGQTFSAHRDMEPRVFRALLNFIYTDMFPDVDDDKGEQEMAMAQHLLVAADRYGVERLKQICEDKLCSYITKSSVGTILALAEQHGCGVLKEACFDFLMSDGNLKDAVATDGFEHLTNSCPSVLKELLSKVAL